MPEKHENLDKLLFGFLDENQARAAAEDIRQGDRILESYPAPEPGPEVLDRINVQISAALASRRPAAVKWFRRSAMAAVAMIFIALAVTILMPGHRTGDDEGSGVLAGGKLAAGAIPQVDSLLTKAVTEMNAEMDDLLDRVTQISRDEYYFEDTVSDLDTVGLDEMEMVATNDDFWKD